MPLRSITQPVWNEIKEIDILVCTDGAPHRDSSSYKGGLRVSYDNNLEYVKFYAKTFSKENVSSEPNRWSDY